MSSNDFAVRVQNLSKCYQIYENPRDRLKQFVVPPLLRLMPWFHRFFGAPFTKPHPACRDPSNSNPSPVYYKEFWALKDVSFEVKKGETIGIIGRNGSGKSTLLQMICGTLTPTEGSIETSGRIAALLELGSGFNPEFTGRENVYMNASVLGLTVGQINARFNDIAEFADIGEFIDQPVKNYSSGMYVRLAYAVVAHVSADILVVDEALAVGDVFFQQKCMRHLRQFQKEGGTVIFVSHDTAAVTNLCDSALLLLRGEIVATGKTQEICQKYVEDIYATRNPILNFEEKSPQEPSTTNLQLSTSDAKTVGHYMGGAQPENIFQMSAFRVDASSFGQGGAKIIDVWFEDNANVRILRTQGGDRVNFCLKVQANQTVHFPAFGFILKDRLGQNVIGEGTDLAFRHHMLVLQKGNVAVIKFSFSMPILIQANYALDVAVAEGIGDDHVQHHWINDAIVLHSLNSRLVHGICGLQNLEMSLQIN